jgi:paraquat-inducible protein B
MSKKASPTVIGIFTLIGLILAGVAAVLFGAGKYFENTYPILLHFDKSAYGLQVGSSVRFGGVRIGSVRSISVLVDPEENRKVIPVIVDLREKDLSLISSETGGGIDLTTREGVEKAVAVRYAYTSQPLGHLLYNTDGMPVGPFTTCGYDEIRQPRK